MLTELELKRLIAETLQVSSDRVTWDAELVGDLGADSLALIQLTAVLEQQMGRKIPPDALFDITTVGDLKDFIKQSDGA